MDNNDQHIKDLIAEALQTFQPLVYQENIPPGQIKQRHILEGYIIFHGLAAARPTNVSGANNPVNAYFATDSHVLSIWIGNAWKSVTLS